MDYIDKEDIREQIKGMIDRYAVCRNAIYRSKDLKNEGNLICKKIHRIDDIKKMIESENELIIKNIDKMAIPFHKTKSFDDNNNLYHDLLEIRPRIKDIKFVLMNPVNYNEILQIHSGTVWHSYIAENMTNNILRTNQVPLDTIYTGNIGKEIAELFIDIDFEIDIRDNEIYVGYQVFLECSNDSESFAKIIYNQDS